MLHFFFLSISIEKMRRAVSCHSDWTDFVVVLIFWADFKIYSCQFLWLYCSTILWTALFSWRKRKKKPYNTRQLQELFSCRIKRKQAIPRGHDMTWHTHTARLRRQSENRIPVIILYRWAEWKPYCIRCFHGTISNFKMKAIHWQRLFDEDKSDKQ